MDAREKYEADIISLRAFGIQRRERTYSDEDCDREESAKRTLEELVNAFRLQVLLNVLPHTQLRRDQIQDLLDAMADATPNFIRWEHAISEARNGE